MRLLTSRGKRKSNSRSSNPMLELLEDRRLLSASVVVPFDTSPVLAGAVNATAGKRFSDVVATWSTTDGLPARSSGIVAVAIVNWGDNRMSRAKLVDDGSGVIQIIGTHVWAKPGTFNTTVTVEEFPRAHQRQITQIGTADGGATVAPRPHVISIKGTITGTYTTPLGNPDARSYVFTGSGTSKVPGAVMLDGTITPPGFIRSAPATGELTLTAATGTVTLDLTGHPQNGGSPLPQKMNYVITGGTGAFVNTTGRGILSIAVNDTDSTFVFVIH